MALKQKASTSGATKKRSGKSHTAAQSKASKSKSKGPAAPAKQHRPKSTLSQQKKKPPHARYTEADLKLAPLNGIRPAGVQKLPNKKKGKRFVNEDSMRTILAMVMAEKEGNIESKMMRVRQLEELREARRIETEKRAEGKQEKFEERKSQIKNKKKNARMVDTPDVDGDAVAQRDERKRPAKRSKKVSFG